MLFPDIKSYLIDIEQGEDEIYLEDLENCYDIDHLIQIVSSYYGIDEYEGAKMILDKVTKY